MLYLQLKHSKSFEKHHKHLTFDIVQCSENSARNRIESNSSSCRVCFFFFSRVVWNLKNQLCIILDEYFTSGIAHSMCTQCDALNFNCAELMIRNALSEAHVQLLKMEYTEIGAHRRHKFWYSLSLPYNDGCSTGMLDFVLAKIYGLLWCSTLINIIAELWIFLKICTPKESNREREEEEEKETIFIAKETLFCLSTANKRKRQSELVPVFATVYIRLRQNGIDSETGKFYKEQMSSVFHVQKNFITEIPKSHRKNICVNAFVGNFNLVFWIRSCAQQQLPASVFTFRPSIHLEIDGQSVTCTNKIFKHPRCRCEAVRS